MIRAARKQGLKPCLRMNGATDIAWERVKMESGLTILEFFPGVQFVDYTKNLKRALAHARGDFPPNYHLTFSRSETNEKEAIEVLEAGGNIAVVSSLPKPETYLMAPVIDGDLSDLRHLDPRGVVVWLSPKGAKAKADKSGFVVR
ncbi:MAG TPA: hypothetical protein VGG86_14020 [Roseiarcus sp.]